MVITLLGRRSSAALALRHHRILTTRLGNNNAPLTTLTAATAHQCPSINPPAKSTTVPLLSHRTLHATSSAPFAAQQHASSAPTDDAGGIEKKTGFESLINRRSNRGGRSSRKEKPNYTQVEASMTTLAPEDEWLDDDDDDGIIPALGDKNNVANEYDFGSEHHHESELQDWHKNKEEEFHQLTSTTESTLAKNERDIEAILSLMKGWNIFLSSVTSGLYSQSDFRRQYPQYPPSDFMTSITYDAAEKSESLLAHLLGGGGGGSSSLPPVAEVNAYKLTMSAWSQVFHPHSGDRCENILEQYGERFGGDMNFMPTVDAYKTVLEAHLKSCSSYSTSIEGGSSPGEKALGVLTLLANVHTAGDMFLKPDVELYSHTIAAVRNTLLDWQSRRRFQHEDLSLESDLAGGLLDSLERMESSLEDETKKSKKKDEGVQLSLHQWHCAIRAYADGLAIVSSIPIGDDENNIAERLLMKLEHLLTNNCANILLSIDDAGLSDKDVQNLLGEIQRRVEDSYNCALSSGLTLSKEAGSFPDFTAALNNAVSSEEIFQGMKHRSQESSPDMTFLFPPPISENYRALVECWCECVRKRYSTPESNDAMAKMEELPHLRAERILQQLEMQQTAKPIDGSVYLAVVWAWSQVLNWPAIYRKSDYFFAANAIDELLKNTMDRYANGSVHFSWNGTVTKMYNMVFRLNSKIFKGGEGAMKRSLNLLDQMAYWHKQSEGAIAKPDTFTFGLIMKTVSNSGAQSSASNAETILQRMEDFGVKPRESHYLGVIRAYSRVGRGDVSDPSKAEAILQRVKEKHYKNKSVKPTTAIYTACISAYGGSKNFNSVSKVMELFEELNDLYKETNDEAFQPDSMLYSEVLGAISKANSKKDASLHKALKMLDTMEKSYDSGLIEAGPNRYAYTNLLHAISRSRAPDAASLAQDLMQRMDNRSRQLDDESICPDAHAYTTMIHILSHSKDPDSVERAQKWFMQMKKQYEDGDLGSKPNKVTYTALINCWRHSNRAEAGEEADNIVSMMEAKYEEGDMDLKPDAFVYASAIDAWARCNSLEKAVRAWDIYQRMKKQYLNGNMESKPNNVIITSIIKACGYTKGSRENRQNALKVLLQCLTELKSAKYISPNSLTYRSSLIAVRALVADDAIRRPITATIFETCCRNGHLDETVLQALERVQPDLYVKLPGDIPSKWKQNANGKEARG
ncbi:hypothetical protein ACHAXR_008532 [Thalassiosira sp. AJA248-18]